MDLGIIGLPQAGKKTIFGLLSGIDATRAPTRGPVAYGIAPVRDPRVDRLSAMYNPKRTRYAEFQIALPPDVQPATSRGAEWLEPIRRVDALLHVVRAFPGERVFHIEGSVDAARDIELVDTEFMFADLALIETRLERMSKEQNRRATNTNPEREKAVLERCRAHLESDAPLRTLELNADEQTLIRALQFLTIKPVVVAINVGEDVPAASAELAPLTAALQAKGTTVVFLSAALEAELAELPDDERLAFMADLGVHEPAAHRLSRAAYESLGLISFFTVGPDEVRGWPLRRGAKAPEAAGRIHSDLERGFIRADTIPCSVLLEAGSEKAARDAKLFRLNGKDYEVLDGDVIEIRFSV